MSIARTSIFALMCGVIVMIASATPALAHPARMASGIATVRPNGEVTVSLSFDLLAFLLNDTPARVSDSQMLALLDGPADAMERKVGAGRNRLVRSVQLIVDGTAVPTEVSHFPTAGEVVAASQVTGVPRLPVILKAEIAARLPKTAKSIQFRISDVLDTLILTVERPDEEAIAFPLQAGTDSDPVTLNFAVDSAPVSVTPVAEAKPASMSWHTIGQYTVLGFEHILPKGLDHILFVLGLFLLSPKLKPLLTQVTCFTFAHSITLALAAYGLVRVPAAIVEPVIALSIAFIAVENLWATDLKPWRPLVIFAFGLVHGLGFAGVLLDTGLPRTSFLPAVISFNVGVELGQLAVIALAFAAVGWASNRKWYRSAVVWPASVCIALVGLYWTVERVLA